MNVFLEPAGIFAVVMAVGLVAPYLSDRIGIPVVASMTLAGILLGPELLGLLEPGALLQLFGSLGLVFVFFSAGAETNLGIIKRRPLPSILFGFLTFVLPFAAGFIFGYFFFGRTIVSALILGAFFASSGSRMFAGLLRQDLLVRESSEIGVAGAGLSRIAVAILLFVSSFTAADPLILPSLSTIALWLLYFLVLGFSLPRFAPFVLRSMRTQGGIDAMFLLFLIYASASLASLLGLPSYLGALYSGMLLSTSLSSSKTIPSRIGLLGESFFLPFLFVFIGASANFSQIQSLPRVLPFIVASVFLGLGSKVLAAYITGKVLRLSPEDRGLLFGFSSCFSGFSLATASVAGSSGYFDQPLLGGAVILIILSSSLTSLAARHSGSALLRRNLGEPAKSQRKATSSEGSDPDQGTAKPWSLKPELGRAKEHQARSGFNHGVRRILIALSKPASAHFLMELGETLQNKGSSSPLYPLVVISEQENEQRGRAETMLAAAIMRGLDPQTPVSPLYKVEMNAASGILQSAQEQGADTILVGWHKPPRLANAFFGSVIDQILNSSDLRILVARLVSPLHSSHIIAVLPPLCSSHEGFHGAVSILESLGKKHQAKVHLLTLKGHGSSLFKSLRESGCSLSIIPIEMDTWKDIKKALATIPGQSRFFLLFSARPSEPSWHPAVERLPHRIGEEFPQSNLMIIYMARKQEPFLAGTISSSGESLEAENLSTQARDNYAERSASPALMGILETALAQGTVRVNMRHGAIADGIFELVSSAFPFDRRVSSRLSNLLTENVQRQPIEISPGILLLHERLEGIRSPIVCLGSQRQGFRISLLEKPAKILIIILVPEDEKPEGHLALLGDIASLFRKKDLGRRLLEAEKPEDLLPPA